MLYISTERNESQWLNAIPNYNLKGHHIRITNQKLRKDLDTLVYFIPTYMIIDKNGEIVVLEAERPHTKSKLNNQLIESIK